MRADESANNIEGRPDVKKIIIVVSSEDMQYSYLPVKLKLKIFACYEIGNHYIRTHGNIRFR